MLDILIYYTCLLHYWLQNYNFKCNFSAVPLQRAVAKCYIWIIIKQQQVGYMLCSLKALQESVTSVLY